MNKDQVNYTVKKIEAYNEKIAQIDKSTYKAYALAGMGVALTTADIHQQLKAVAIGLAGASAIYITVKECQKISCRNRIEALEDRLEMHNLETEEKPKEYIIK